MGLREKMNKQPAVVAAVVIVAIIIAGFVIFRSVSGMRRPTRATQAFFTVDDGKTWFADSIDKVPPFKTADGKEAVGAVVASCKGGRDPFVMYLFRYNAEGKQELESGKSNPGTASKQELKKPGKTEWVPQTDYARANAINAIECPPGQDEFQLINP